MGEREPVPELTEQGHPNNSHHVGGTSFGLHRDGDVPASGIDNALRDGGTELGKRILVLVGYGLFKQFTSHLGLGSLGFAVLNQDHGERDECSLTNKVGRVLRHRLQDLDGFL